MPCTDQKWHSPLSYVWVWVFVCFEWKPAMVIVATVVPVTVSKGHLTFTENGINYIWRGFHCNVSITEIIKTKKGNRGRGVDFMCPISLYRPAYFSAWKCDVGDRTLICCNLNVEWEIFWRNQVKPFKWKWMRISSRMLGSSLAKMCSSVIWYEDEE